MTQECYSNCLSVVSTCELDASRARSSLTHKHARVTDPQKWKASAAWVSIDTEAGMLSGISRKRSIRSSPCWFTEFCNSQCLSHFAAPFIVVRAETSVAESCVRKHARAQRYEATLDQRIVLAGAPVRERPRKHKLVTGMARSDGPGPSCDPRETQEGEYRPQRPYNIPDLSHIRYGSRGS